MAPSRALVTLIVVILVCECESLCWTNTSLPGTSFVCYKPLRASNATNNVLNTLCHHKVNNISDVTVGVVGFLGAVIAPVALGFTFVNARRIDIGDGMMFQWIMNVSMWLVGMVINFAIVEQPALYYFSTTGGVLLSLGLVAAMLAIRLVGMAVMMVVAGGITLISGWITNEFILCKSNHNYRENYAAIVFVALSTLLVILVKSTGNRKQRDDTDKNTNEERLTSGNQSDNDRSVLISSRHPNYSSVYTSDARSHRNHINTNNDDNHSDDDEKQHSINRIPRMDGYFDGVGGTQYAKANRLKNEKFDQKVLAFIRGRKKFLLGYGISVVIGILFGFQFLPLEFLKSCHKFSCYSVEYVFGHLSGSLLTSTLVLIVYCAVKRCQVTVSGALVGHALCAGVMWGLGLVALLSTNDILGDGIGLPVTLAGSCIISSPVGVIFFKEIRGWYIVFYLSLFTLRVTGMVLYAVSYN